MRAYDNLFNMKEQIYQAILPKLPILGTIKLTSIDNKSLRSIEIIKTSQTQGMTPFFKFCHQQFTHFLNGSTHKLEIKVDLSEVSEFQLKVLKAMATIPYGQTLSYKDLAHKLPSRAYQAVGSACGRNPLILIYPCHRIVAQHGIGGFVHGSKMKSALLRLENPSFLAVGQD